MAAHDKTRLIGRLLLFLAALILGRIFQCDFQFLDAALFARQMPPQVVA